jgi:hypothetical protein
MKKQHIKLPADFRRKFEREFIASMKATYAKFTQIPPPAPLSPDELGMSELKGAIFCAYRFKADNKAFPKKKLRKEWRKSQLHASAVKHLKLADSILQQHLIVVAVGEYLEVEMKDYRA